MKKMLQKILTLSLVLIGQFFAVPANTCYADGIGSEILYQVAKSPVEKQVERNIKFIGAGRVIQGAATGVVGWVTNNEDIKKAGKEMRKSGSYMIKMAKYNNPKDCEAGNIKGCYPFCKYHEYIAEKTTCTLCPLFAIVFNTASKVSATAINVFSNSVVRVVVVAFAIWLAIQILTFASSVETRDLKDLAQSIITQGFYIVLVTVIIKIGVADFSNAFIAPVYNTGTAMAKSMYSTCTKNQTPESCEETKKIFSKKYDLIKEIDNGLPSNIGHSIVQTMTVMEYNVLKYKALGNSMFCQAWKDSYFIAPHFRYMLVGALLWVLSSLIIIVVPFLMIDSVFQLSVAAALLPIAVGCYAFKWSRKYTKQVWDTILNSMFSFVFISVVVLILIGTIQSTIEGGLMSEAPGNFDDMFTSFNSSGDAHFAYLMDNLSWASNPFLKIIFIFLLAWTVMKMAQEFAGEFASSISKSGIGMQIGEVAASSVKSTATKIMSPTATAIGHSIDRGVRSTLKNGGALTRFVRNRNRKRLIAQANNAPTTGTSNRIVTTNGNTIKIVDNNTGDIIISNDDVEITLKKDKNGRYQSKLKRNSKTFNQIIDNKGQADFAKMSQILNGLSGQDRELVETELMRSLASERISAYAHDYKRAKLKSPPQIVKRDTATGEITIKETTESGEVVFTTQKMNARTGLLETDILKVDNKGKVTRLYSDGIRNKLEKFELRAGFDASSTTDVADIYRNHDTAKGRKTSYGYTSYWQSKIDDGTLGHRDVPLGGMDVDEVNEATNFIASTGNEFQKADLKLHFG